LKSLRFDQDFTWKKMTLSVYMIGTAEFN